MDPINEWLVHNYGALGALVVFIGMFVTWLWRDSSAKRAAKKSLEEAKDNLIDKALKTIEDNTRAIDQTREADHAWQVKLAEGLQHLSTLVEERLPRRGGR